MLIACDPGLSGAFATLWNVGADGIEIGVKDMPTTTLTVGSPARNRRFLDERGIIALLKTARLLGASRLIMEKVNGAPGQSAPAAFSFGYGVGFIVACAMAEGMEIERVEPAIWKRALKVPADKRASRARASELLPAFADLWPNAGHDGRAEAAMIALYAHRFIR